MKPKTTRQFAEAIADTWERIGQGQLKEFTFETKGAAQHWKQKMYLYRKSLREEAPGGFGQRFDKFSLITQLDASREPTPWLVKVKLDDWYERTLKSIGEQPKEVPLLDEAYIQSLLEKSSKNDGESPGGAEKESGES
jgi:hypothetical protein